MQDQDFLLYFSAYLNDTRFAGERGNSAEFLPSESRYPTAP